MDQLTIPVIKDVATIIGYLIAIIGGVYSFFKWIYPKIVPYFINIWYYHDTGIHILRNIEKSIGKEAGQIIKDILHSRAQTIRLSEMRLNIIENAVGIGIYICNDRGECTYSNKTLAKMFGISQEEMLGYGWLSPVVDKQSVYENWKFAVQSNTPYRDEYEVELGGEILTYHTEAEPSLSDVGGIVLGYVGIVRNLNK